MRVEEIHGVAEEGTTEPIRCRLSDGHDAFVKYPNNRCGTPVLINEWVGNKVAKAIGVNTPDFGVCFLSKEVIELSMLDDELDDNNAGICFFSGYLHNTVPLKLWKSQGSRETAKIILLDHILNNFDRNEGSLLYDIGMKKLYAIDYSHIFSRGPKINYHTDYIKKGMTLEDYLYTEILYDNKKTYDQLALRWGYSEQTMRGEASHIKNGLSRGFFQSIFNDLPQEWSYMLDAEIVKKLVNFLTFRSSHINSICEMIIKERRSC